MSISYVNSYGRFEKDKYEYEDKYRADRSPIYICPLGVLNKYTSNTSLSMCPTGDPYKSKSAISRRSECYKYMIRIRISLL